MEAALLPSTSLSISQAHLVIDLGCWQALHVAWPVDAQQRHGDLATALGHAVAVEELTAQVCHNASVLGSEAEWMRGMTLKCMQLLKQQAH